MPSATFPEGATLWKAKTAIGAGPVLIKDGKYINSYIEELFDSESGIGPESNNPRTAVGITKSGIMIFFVCEGRNMTQGVVGFTLDEETKILLSLGCTEALNLDGGGSSCLLINGKETIKPSDGKQRSVVTAVSLK
jgi:exopolysaccharide biosynthesis protein